MSDDYRIIVTGWRDWPLSHRGIIWEKLDAVAWHQGSIGRRIVVAQGECPYGGVDLYAKQWAELHGHGCVPYPAEVTPRGKILGPARNTRMVNDGGNLCLSFPGPGSRGTWDCTAKAVDADIPVELAAWCTSYAAQWTEHLDG